MAFWGIFEGGLGSVDADIEYRCECRLKHQPPEFNTILETASSPRTVLGKHPFHGATVVFPRLYWNRAPPLTSSYCRIHVLLVCQIFWQQLLQRDREVLSWVAHNGYSGVYLFAWCVDVPAHKVPADRVPSTVASRTGFYQSRMLSSIPYTMKYCRPDCVTVDLRPPIVYSWEPSAYPSEVGLHLQ